jgi:hypothetical protein
MMEEHNVTKEAPKKLEVPAPKAQYTVNVTSLRQQEALQAVIEERAYQDKGQGNAKSNLNRDYSGAEWLCMIATYVRKAQDAWSGTHPEELEQCKHELRKIAALALASMEQPGGTRRREGK